MIASILRDSESDVLLSGTLSLRLMATGFVPPRDEQE
jgi:hypothetical protein